MTGMWLEYVVRGQEKVVNTKSIQTNIKDG